MLVYLLIIVFLLIFTFSFSSFSQNVFDDGVRNIEIFFNDPNWDDTLDVYYANGIGQRLIADSILIDGEADQNVGIKYKGNSSYNINNTKNPMNIKLDFIDNGQSIDGYNVLKLSNGFRDPSFVREVLSYDMARDYMPAPKATYANVFVNGTLLGLYTCVQSIDDDFTNENFYERKGPFFKVENTGISVSGCFGPLGILEYYSDTNCYQRAYEMQSSNDWTKLGYFLDTLNNHFTDIENVMDIDRTLWMLSFENITVCLDGPINSIPHNFYLFKDNNGRFSPLLWDMNMAFGTFTNGLPSPVQNSDLQELDIFHNSNDLSNQLTNQFFSSDRYKKMYVAHMRTILTEQFANNNYSTRALALQQLIDSDVNSDPNPFYSYAEFTSNLNSSVGAKKDLRLKKSGKLIGFKFKEESWGLDDHFYDWLYLIGLLQNNKIANYLLSFDGFTDIEFNPKKSYNCQAHSAALYLSALHRGIDLEKIKSPKFFKEVFPNNTLYKFSQAELF